MAKQFYRTQADPNQPMIVGILRKRGFQVYHLGRPVDLLIAKDRRMALAEVKKPEARGLKKEYTPSQKKFLSEWRGPAIFILRTKEDALHFEL